MWYRIVLLSVGLCVMSVCEAASGPTHGKVVVCYLGSWAVYRPDRGSFAIEHLDPSLCTHLIYSFAGLDTKNDRIKSLDPWQDLTEDYGKGGYQRLTALKNKYPHLKVSLAIGGWNEGSVNFSLLAATPEKRTKFAQNVVMFLRKYRFDGLDLDWEFPGQRGGRPEDKTNFLLLVKELKAAFRKDKFLLTAALGAGKDTIDKGYNVKAISSHLDFIHMMCYDYHGAWDRRTGANAPLRANDELNVEFTINYILKQGAPPQKLVLGVPFYGRTFIIEGHRPEGTRPQLGEPANNGFQGPYTRENGFLGYNEICLELKNTSAPWKIYWDSESQTPFAVHEDKVMTYDNEQSIAEKVHFAIEKRLAGIMVWSVDTDDFHGDCTQGDDEQFENYPLLRCINKSIEKSLSEMENNIIQGKEPHSSSSSVLKFSGLVVLSVLLLSWL